MGTCFADRPGGRRPVGIGAVAMCGIIGLTGVDDALPVILEGLGRLEYRGYASAGVALSTAGALWRARAAEGTHSVNDLRTLSEDAPLHCRTGVGHTRWATHGRPTTGNAHPHLDCTGRLALVHNGIIENHAGLAEGLLANGHTLRSETDTEVVVHLIEEHVAAGATLVESMRAVLKILRGSMSMAVISAD